MSIEPQFTSEQFRAALLKKKKRIDSLIVRRLQYLGELCVNNARSMGSYTDQTGNLRNSVGYLVIANGQIVHKNFEGSGYQSQGAKKNANKQGKLAGAELANKIAAEYQSGFVLIVVAGMNYAFYVEHKGYNVLTSAKNLAVRELPIIMKQLQDNIKKA